VKIGAKIAHLMDDKIAEEHRERLQSRVTAIRQAYKREIMGGRCCVCVFFKLLTASQKLRMRKRRPTCGGSLMTLLSGELRQRRAEVLSSVHFEIGGAKMNVSHEFRVSLFFLVYFNLMLVCCTHRFNKFS